MSHPPIMGMSPADFRRFLAFKEQRRIDAQRIADRYQQNARANAASRQNDLARGAPARGAPAPAPVARAPTRLNPAAAEFVPPAPPTDPVMSAYSEAPEDVGTTLKLSGAFDGRGRRRRGGGKILSTLWGYPTAEDLDEDEMEELEREHRAAEAKMAADEEKERLRRERAEARRLERERDLAYNDYFQTIRAGHLMYDRGVTYAPAFERILNHYLGVGLTQDELFQIRDSADTAVTNLYNKQEDDKRSGQGHLRGCGSPRFSAPCYFSE